MRKMSDAIVIAAAVEASVDVAVLVVAKGLIDYVTESPNVQQEA